jgi:diketogulonate reductase-like aldo/keto reductase
LESDVQEGCELTLRDLQLDHLDLYLIHWPARVRKGAVTGKMTKDDQMGYDEEVMAQTWRVRGGREREKGRGKGERER